MLSVCGFKFQKKASHVCRQTGGKTRTQDCGEGIENNAKGLFNPLPAASRDVRQHIIDMRVAPKGGSNAENEIIDHDLRVFPKCVTRRSDGEGRGGRRFILWVDISP